MDEKSIQITPAAISALARGDVENFLVAATPGGIEAQEAQGQQDFVASETLPLEMLHGTTREQFEKLGFVFGEPIDDLFVAVKMPEGWSKRPTSHSMWSDLLDSQGRKRASIFYKAAFYDRSAHVSLNRRFRCACMLGDFYKTDIGYEERDAGNWFGVVYDGENIVWKSDPISGASYEQQDELGESAKAWLDDNFPEWENVLAYWD